jgi:hypothetical protein
MPRADRQKLRLRRVRGAEETISIVLQEYS